MLPLCSHEDCWQAATVDGREWCQHDPPLQVKEHSPWRELEAISKREGFAVLWAQVNLDGRFLRMEAEGRPLVCGELLTQETSMTGGGNVNRRYRWVRRDELTRRVWGIVGAEGAWQYETPPDCEACPDPPMT